MHFLVQCYSGEGISRPLSKGSSSEPWACWSQAGTGNCPGPLEVQQELWMLVAGDSLQTHPQFLSAFLISAPLPVSSASCPTSWKTLLQPDACGFHVETQDSHRNVLLILSPLLIQALVQPQNNVFPGGTGQGKLASLNCVKRSKGHVSSAHSSPTSMFSESKGPPSTGASVPSDH